MEIRNLIIENLKACMNFEFLNTHQYREKRNSIEYPKSHIIDTSKLPTLKDSAGKNSSSVQIRVGQCQKSDEKLMSDTRFFSGRTIRTRVNSGQNRVQTIEMQKN